MDHFILQKTVNFGAIGNGTNYVGFQIDEGQSSRGWCNVSTFSGVVRCKTNLVISENCRPF